VSFATERAAIEGRLASNWTTTDIAYVNVPFAPDNAAPWVRLNILNGESGPRNVNDGKRHLGVIVLQIFVPQNTGTATARTYADSLATIFEDAQFSGILCGVASIETIGNTGTWYQINVTVGYWRDEN